MKIHSTPRYVTLNFWKSRLFCLYKGGQFA
jgi:hypothetical protein